MYEVSALRSRLQLDLSRFPDAVIDLVVDTVQPRCSRGAKQNTIYSCLDCMPRHSSGFQSLDSCPWDTPLALPPRACTAVCSDFFHRCDVYRYCAHLRCRNIIRACNTCAVVCSNCHHNRICAHHLRDNEWLDSTWYHKRTGEWVCRQCFDNDHRAVELRRVRRGELSLFLHFPIHDASLDKRAKLTQ